MKVIIIGGVAAGASAAARLRRLDEKAQIILLEKGKFISYANCGLPYHLGGVIPDRDDLLVMEPEKFQSWFDIEVRTENEAVKIDRAGKLLHIRKADGTEYQESYDKLLIATGAARSSGSIGADGLNCSGSVGAGQGSSLASFREVITCAITTTVSAPVSITSK